MAPGQNGQGSVRAERGSIARRNSAPSAISSQTRGAMSATAEKPDNHGEANRHPISATHVSPPLTEANLVAFEHQISPNRQTDPTFLSKTKEESLENMKKSMRSLGLELADWVIEEMAQGYRSGVGLEALFLGHPKEERRPEQP